MAVGQATLIGNWLKGKTKQATSGTVKVYGDEVVSYGFHWPLLSREADGSVWLNTGIVGRTTWRHYTMTTSGHFRAAFHGLLRSGYRETEDTKTVACGGGWSGRLTCQMVRYTP